MNILLLIALIIASYLLGSISFGRIVSSIRNVDITKQGSGNPGMTNVMRTHGALMGFLVLVLDGMKGALPALAGVLLFGGYVPSDYVLVTMGTANSYLALFACGFASIIGHIYPIFYKFKGGKGVATFLGVLFVAQPLLSSIVFVVALIALLLCKLMSVISIGIIVSLSTLQIIFAPNGSSPILYVILGFLIALCIYTHRANIVRLYKGTENLTSLQEAFKKDKQRIKKEMKTKKYAMKKNYKADKKDLRKEKKEKLHDIKENKKQLKALSTIEDAENENLTNEQQHTTQKDTETN